MHAALDNLSRITNSCLLVVLSQIAAPRRRACTPLDYGLKRSTKKLIRVHSKVPISYNLHLVQRFFFALRVSFFFFTFIGSFFSIIMNACAERTFYIDFVDWRDYNLEINTSIRERIECNCVSTVDRIEENLCRDFSR